MGLKLQFRGKHAEFLRDETREIDLEGSLSSGKTVVALYKQILRIKQHPGIWTLITRWTGDAVDTKLRPLFEQICRLEGLEPAWNDKEKYYAFENGSRTYAFGLKTTSIDPDQRYEKIRGLPVSDIYVDQPESVPADIAEELRLRLRPDLIANVEGKRFPQHIVFTPNPVPKHHWLATQFPEDNSFEGRKYMCVSLDDNAHNLEPDMIRAAWQTYPPEHPMHRIKILGLRGVSISGDAVYGKAFSRDLHLRRTELNPFVPLLEVIEFGKRNLCVLWSQFDQWGRWLWHGGLMAPDIGLGAFLDILTSQRSQWFEKPSQVLQACKPVPMTQELQTTTILETFRQHQLYPRTVENSNQPLVRKAAIERTRDYLTRRGPKGESFLVDPDRWLIVGADEWRDEAFGPEALQFGYVWDKKTKRAGNTQVTFPTEDGWYEHVMTCAELTELNFGRSHQTEAQIKKRAAAAARAELRKAQADPKEAFHWNRSAQMRRGGY